MAVAKDETPAWMRRPWVNAAFNAIILLHYGLLWVAAAGRLAIVSGGRFFGVVEGSPVFSAASSVIRYSLTYAFSLGIAAGMLIYERRMRSVPKDSKKGIKDPLTLVVIGGLVLVAFMMLIAAADFVVGQSPLKGSQGAQVGSIWKDLGLLGAAVTQHFIIIPTTAPSQRRVK